MNIVHHSLYSKPFPAAIWEDFPEVAGKSVFIKPNLVTPPGIFDKQSVTHPEVIRQVLCKVREEGANKIIVGCCGFKNQWGPTIKQMGLEDICSQYEAELICVQEGPNFHNYSLRRLENYLSLYGTKISNFVLESDIVINLPKMKVHTMAGMTGAIKNMMGVISPKGSMHPGANSDILHKRLADLYALMSPIVSWSLMDGIVGAEYSEQYGVEKYAYTLISGIDMWEVDAAAAQVMGYKISDIRYLRIIQKMYEKPSIEFPKGEWVVPFERPLIMRGI